MLSVPFLLGFFGSVHCLGMCGPLAMGVAHTGQGHWAPLLRRAFLYNLGRALTYAVLGLLVGSIAQQFLKSGWQQNISIFAGALLILLFFMTITPETLLQKSTWYRKGLSRWQKKLGQAMQKWGQSSALVLGLLNGLLPCGLVYIALAGALAFSAAWQSALFMFMFGIGTVPALFILMTGSGRLPIFKSRFFRKALPTVQLAMGVFLIYRGIAVELPFDLSWYLQVEEPPMCH